ncbi:hypothetical protein GCM10011581_13940 [Saccharopolyspora subtropica]|uniref:Secreted protein n=1 Tax=Saccharopolyspora thermophila TaxID=89367 RepID=A0A917JMW3_9PSEU|nr:hypothetical protein GCM10011581_13940 [Saccharopolyspora subtropica]
MERPVAREPAPAPASDGGDVRAYDIMGGQVVLSLHPNYAELISATPSPGYSVRTWEHPDGWLRIEFTAGQHGSSLIVTWHDGPIRVSTQAY